MSGVQSGLHGRVDSASTWANIPTALLRAELSRRREAQEKPACGSRGGKGGYNTPLHVFALILILLLSTLACAFPIVVRRFPSLPVPHHFLFLSRHFGTGVLIATAFVHLLPTAFVSLTDPCLPSFWNQGYPAMAGLIAMVSVLVVVGIEMFFATRGAGHVHGSEYDTVPNGERGHGANGSARPGHRRQESLRPFRQADLGLKPPPAGDVQLGDISGSSENLMAGRSPFLDAEPSPLPGKARKYSDNDDEDDEDLDLDELDPTADASGLLNQQRRRGLSIQAPSGSQPTAAHPSHLHSHHPETHSSHTDVSSLQYQQKLLLQCVLLEAGILFHSVFIGMALSVATGTSFVVLLVAISFHQTFEGLALGSRIAAISLFPARSPKPWLMALAYGTTTPMGQAIGLLIHNLYDPASQTGLLMVGVMNAISSGLLLFAGLVELLAEDFLSDRSYDVLWGRKRLEACGAVMAGALLMALVGAFA